MQSYADTSVSICVFYFSMYCIYYCYCLIHLDFGWMSFMHGGAFFMTRLTAQKDMQARMSQSGTDTIKKCLNLTACQRWPSKVVVGCCWEVLIQSVVLNVSGRFGVRQFAEHMRQWLSKAPRHSCWLSAVGSCGQTWTGWCYFQLQHLVAPIIIDWLDLISNICWILLDIVLILWYVPQKSSNDMLLESQLLEMIRKIQIGSAFEVRILFKGFQKASPNHRWLKLWHGGSGGSKDYVLGSPRWYRRAKGRLIGSFSETKPWGRKGTWWDEMHIWRKPVSWGISSWPVYCLPKDASTVFVLRTRVHNTLHIHMLVLSQKKT